MTKPEVIRFKPEFEKELLRLGVKTRFLKNRIKHCEKTGEDIQDTYPCKNFWWFIILAFEWDSTPEKSKFWKDVANGIKPD